LESDNDDDDDGANIGDDTLGLGDMETTERETTPEDLPVRSVKDWQLLRDRGKKNKEVSFTLTGSER
jgi:hypothetical protein